jgi:hypothetical protein
MPEEPDKQDTHGSEQPWMDIHGNMRGDNYAEISYHCLIGLVHHDVSVRIVCCGRRETEDIYPL